MTVAGSPKTRRDVSLSNFLRQRADRISTGSGLSGNDWSDYYVIVMKPVGVGNLHGQRPRSHRVPPGDARCCVLRLSS